MAAKEKLNRKQKRERVRQIPWTIFAALVYSIFYIPVLVMILFSFNDAKRNYSWAGFTTKWYPKLFSFGNHDLWESLAYSLIIAVVVTIISVIIGSAINNTTARKTNTILSDSSCNRDKMSAYILLTSEVMLRWITAVSAFR